MTDKQPYHIDLVKPGAVLHLRCGGTIPGEIFKNKAPMVHSPTIFWDVITGRWLKNVTHDFDIIAITPASEPKRLHGFLNVYPNRHSSPVTHLSTKTAADHRGPECIACIDLSKIYDESGNPITEGFGL